MRKPSKHFLWIVCILLCVLVLNSCSPSIKLPSDSSSENNKTSDSVEETGKNTKTENTTTEAFVPPEQKTYVLSAGCYLVGVDIPAGRAKVSGVSGTGNIISSDYDGLKGINSMVMTDSSGKANMASLFESYNVGKGAIWYISQTAVIQLDYTSFTSSCTGRQYDQSPSYELVSGNYVVGIDIEPGVYRVEAAEGMGNFIAGNCLDGGANEMMSTDSKLGSSSFANVFLHKDDELVITMNLHLNLYKASGDVPQKTIIAETEDQTKPVNTLEAVADDVIRPEIKEAIDSYEAFIDEYCAFMAKYDVSDLSMLSQYAKLVASEAEMSRKFDALEENDLTTAEENYYTEVSMRCTQKMLEAMSQIH